MPVSTFTSKNSFRLRSALLCALFLFSLPAFAVDGRKDSLPSDDDEFKNTPFTEYGSFNQDEDEDAETRFMQYGRLFGVSLGVGSEGAFGNRSQLWQGGFPMMDLKVHYWFDFHLALALGVTVAHHSFAAEQSNLGNVDVNTTHVGADLRYYFDVKNLSAPISFINPYVFGGAGSFSKTETAENDQSNSVGDTALALDAGLGIEFAVAPKKTYFQFEAKVMNASFKDADRTTNGYTGLGSLFYTASAGFMFTW